MKIIFSFLLLLPVLAQAHKISPCSASSAKGDTCTVDIISLRPTQMCVGMRVVLAKEAKLSKKNKSDLDAYEQKNPEPIIVGPGGELYIIDHHHLARALYEIGERSTYGSITENLSNLDEKSFWDEMNKNGWDYLFDHGTGPLSYTALPKTVLDMQDDSYRSLAEVVRDAGGYDKTSILFADFIWADFFRSRVSLGSNDQDFDDAGTKATALAQSSAAAGLPGYNVK